MWFSGRVLPLVHKVPGSTPNTHTTTAATTTAAATAAAATNTNNHSCNTTTRGHSTLGGIRVDIFITLMLSLVLVSQIFAYVQIQIAYIKSV